MSLRAIRRILSRRYRNWKAMRAVKKCCRTDENLVLFQLRTDFAVRICGVCGCRHFELSVDPGKIGFEGAPIR